MYKNTKIFFPFLFLFIFFKNSFCFSQKIFIQENISSPIELTLTQEEKDFISAHKTLKVVCDPAWPPFEYYNNSQNIPQYSGVVISILKTIGEELGIQFEFLPTEDYYESKKLIELGRADIITGYTSRLTDIAGLLYSDGLYTIPFVLLSMTGKEPSVGDTIALPQITDKEFQEIIKIYPASKYQYKFFNDPQETLKQIKKGKYKYAFLNEFEINDYKGISNYQIFYQNVNYVQKIAISSALGQTAVSCINKAYHSISTEKFNSIIYSCLLEREFLLKEKQSSTKANKLLLAYLIIFTIILSLSAGGIILITNKKRNHAIDYDENTGMPTYSKFKHDVRLKLRKAKPNEYMILSLDINNFSYINDSYGFNIGNALLIEISQHLLNVCTSNNELICKFYADNFIIFAKKPKDKNEIENIVSKLTDVSDHVRKLLPEQYVLQFSCGIYYISEPFVDLNIMIDKANIARKLNKDSFSSIKFVEYTKEMNEESELKQSITLSMNKAIENGEFEVYYQPKFRFNDIQVVGAEALIRWNNPEKGLLLPGKFIPLFESNGFIQKIDLFVFEEVCKFIDSWNKSCKDGKSPHPITISFNLSRFHLYNSNLISELVNIVSKYKIEPCKIEVELTETVMFDDQKHLVSAMNDLKNAGFSISIDDFGSGYSSLNLLKDMPADVLKLDKEFLSSATDNERESIIINSVINMAKNLKLVTVAEGVETKQQSDLLKNMGCDIVQGFLYSRPIQKTQFRLLLEHSFF